MTVRLVRKFRGIQPRRRKPYERFDNIWHTKLMIRKDVGKHILDVFGLRGEAPVIDRRTWNPDGRMHPKLRVDK